jgi:segregation and condensation protein B
MSETRPATLNDTDSLEPVATQAPNHGNGSHANLEMLLEGLLFVADEPVSISRLAAALEVSSEDIEVALVALQQSCANRGVRLQRAGGRVQFVSAPEMASLIERFLGLELYSKLSVPALEALSVVAYRQPATRADVEAVRGVNSDSVLRTLVSKGLIEEVGRKDAVGRPILYGTTFEFLQFFGLQSLEELPPLEVQDDPADS